MIGKVTFLVSTISNGGAEAVAVNIASGLADAGWDVDLVVLHKKENSYERRLSKNVKVFDLSVKRARFAGPSLLKYFKEKKPKKVVVFKYELIDLVVMLKVLFRLDFGVIGRNITIYGKKRSKRRTKFRRLIESFFGEPLERLDFIINQSKEMEEDLLLHLPALKAKSVVIYNPVAEYIELYKSDSYEVRGSGDPYILCVGRLEEVKAFHHAIDAFSIVARGNGALGLKFVGEGSLETQLKEQVSRLGLDDRVEFLGFQEDLIPLYQNASMTLLTSNHEGFPNVLIESIVLGTSVVSFDCPSGPREILDYGKYGMLVPPGDIQGLAVAIEKTLNEPDQFNLSERAEVFSRRVAIEKYERLLCEK